MSKTAFKLKTKKGLNIPNSLYDDDLQEKLYLEFINRAEKVKFDGIGLSFIQNGDILKKIRTILREKFLVSNSEPISKSGSSSVIEKREKEKSSREISTRIIIEGIV